MVSFLQWWRNPWPQLLKRLMILDWLHPPQKFHSEDALINEDTEPQLIGEDLLSHLTAVCYLLSHLQVCLCSAFMC